MVPHSTINLNAMQCGFDTPHSGAVAGTGASRWEGLGFDYNPAFMLLEIVRWCECERASPYNSWDGLQLPCSRASTVSSNRKRMEETHVIVLRFLRHLECMYSPRNSGKSHTLFNSRRILRMRLALKWHTWKRKGWGEGHKTLMSSFDVMSHIASCSIRKSLHTLCLQWWERH